MGELPQQKFQHRPDLPRTGSVSSSWSKASWKLKSSTLGKNLICLVRVWEDENLVVSLDNYGVPLAERQFLFQWVQMSKKVPSLIQTNLSWKDGEDSTSEVVLQPQSFVNHLKKAATLVIFTKALPSKRGSLPRLRTRSRWSLARKTCESSVGEMSESPFLSY